MAWKICEWPSRWLFSPHITGWSSQLTSGNPSWIIAMESCSYRICLYLEKSRWGNWYVGWPTLLKEYVSCTIHVGCNLCRWLRSRHSPTTNRNMKHETCVFFVGAYVFHRYISLHTYVVVWFSVNFKDFPLYKLCLTVWVGNNDWPRDSDSSGMSFFPMMSRSKHLQMATALSVITSLGGQGDHPGPRVLESAGEIRTENTYKNQPWLTFI